MWTRKEFENAAQKIGEEFVAQGGATPINDLAVKVAQEGGLNPEGIRTVVRLANVTAFEQTFEKRSQSGAEDRMIEFSVGDPEVVISQLHSEVKEAQLHSEVESKYSQANDYYGDINYKKEPLEKTAAAIPGVELQETEAIHPSSAEISALFKRAEDKMQQEQGMAAHLWESSLKKAASLLVATDSRISARDAFEKNAVSTLGADIYPELNMLHKYTSPKGSVSTPLSGVKVAEVLRTHIASDLKTQQPILELLKVAREAREELNVKSQGLQWITENRPEVN